METLIFNLSVFFRVGLNGSPLTSVKMLTAVSVLYDGVDIQCNMLYFEATIVCQAFFLTSDRLALFADWSTLPYVIRRTKQYLAICNTANYTHKTYGFSVPELTPADTFRLGPTDGATTVSCFDLWHTGDAMFVKAINKICVDADLNNKSQISR